MSDTVLIVDDEESILQSLEGILSDEGFEVIKARTGEEAIELIETNIPDIVLLDIWMPGMDGIDALVKIKNIAPSIQVIMMSGHGNVETAVKATKLGAYDFIEKPLSLDKLLLTINNALEHNRLEAEVNLLREKEESKYTIIGHSRAIGELKEQIHLVAPTDAWVLISGENGTGKELVAHAIHRLSKRSDKPMVEVNCAAIPEELIESELFGHEKGAFTGATTMRKGKFDQANNGTIFLDEIGDMSLKAQAKTLRILQEKRFERVGGTKVISVDVRVIAATNKDLEAEIEKGRFREDLYFRLNVIPMRVPPLRERTEDIPELIKHFVKIFSLNSNLPPKKFSPDAISMLQQYEWPGNVRELKNMVERLMIMIPGDMVRGEHIPGLVNRTASNRWGRLKGLVEASSLKEAKIRFEKMFIENKLKECKGNISQTAEAIGLERSNLHKKIKAYGIEIPSRNHRAMD